MEEKEFLYYINAISELQTELESKVENLSELLDNYGVSNFKKEDLILNKNNRNEKAFKSLYKKLFKPLTSTGIINGIEVDYMEYTGTNKVDIQLFTGFFFRNSGNETMTGRSVHGDITISKGDIVFKYNGNFYVIPKKFVEHLPFSDNQQHIENIFEGNL